MSDTITRKSINPEAVKIADDGHVEAVFATLGVIDKDGDVILPGAIDDGASIIVSAYGHKSWDGELPVGTGTIHEIGNEAVAKMDFLMDTAHGADTFRTVKALKDAGKGEWSFSLQNKTETIGEWEGTTANLISSTYVHEVSPVIAGAGVNTRTLSAKGYGVDMKFSEHIDAVKADVETLVERARDVVALRAAKDKTISPDTGAQLDALADELKVLAGTVVSEPDDTDESDAAANEQAANEFARYLTGATTTS